MLVLLLQKIGIRLLLDVVLFPFWWYTKGIVHAFTQMTTRIADVTVQFAPGLWLKNLFVPMFGQYSIEGRMTSVIVRSGNVLIRSLGVLFAAVWYFFFFCVQVVLPAAALYMLIISFGALV